ncbi:hypothetical protein EsDP_00007253 [Epichloe bromicola]|uniref:Uncharacterized protein n=1 Tax=Epichloe bromicola TaxID=79588 RepID=A0ABQ0D015_9HYPO
MNWTGGARSRVRRNGNKDDVARQKEHFAKARMRRDAANGTPEDNKATSSRKLSARQVSSSNKHEQSSGTATVPVMSGGNGPQTPGTSITNGIVRSPVQNTRTPPISRIPETGVDATSIATKKRRLLDQPDWTGVAVQKPLLINYPKSSKKLQASHTSHNLRNFPNKGVTIANSSSRPDNIIVQVGSQDFR